MSTRDHVQPQAAAQHLRWQHPGLRGAQPADGPLQTLQAVDRRMPLLTRQVALSDHYTRKLQLGGKKRQACQLPVGSCLAAVHRATPQPSHPAKPLRCAQGSQLTLAQIVGLIPKPDKLLTAEQWEAVHGSAAQHGQHDCAICLEGIQAEQQVRLVTLQHALHASQLLQCMPLTPSTGRQHRGRSCLARFACQLRIAVLTHTDFACAVFCRCC